MILLMFSFCWTNWKCNQLIEGNKKLWNEIKFVFTFEGVAAPLALFELQNNNAINLLIFITMAKNTLAKGRFGSRLKQNSLLRNVCGNFIYTKNWETNQALQIERVCNLRHVQYT